MCCYSHVNSLQVRTAKSNKWTKVNEDLRGTISPMHALTIVILEERLSHSDRLTRDRSHELPTRGNYPSRPKSTRTYTKRRVSPRQITANDPETEEPRVYNPKCNMRSKIKRLNCPADLVSYQTLLRPSSNCEPSDPPLVVVYYFMIRVQRALSEDATPFG